MAKITRTFQKGRMNKTANKSFVGQGDYIDALNIRVLSTEDNDAGIVTNVKGNTKLSNLSYNGVQLSTAAIALGATYDNRNSTVYWLVHDPEFADDAENPKLDMIVSMNRETNQIKYNVVSRKNPEDPSNTTLNFSPERFVNAINVVANKIYITDNYNDPYLIYTDKTYGTPDPSGFDTFSKEELLVIKKPPMINPVVSMINIPGTNDYLKDRFVSFAYRYKYANNEYSATSQWSKPAFIPSSFNFSTESFLNDGMLNRFNAVEIKFNSGNSLVVGVDILYKEHGNNTIKVAKRIDKREEGYSNNSLYTFVFSNNRSVAILPDDEILRHYDGVPKKAKAQTIIGDRLLYGNYTKGGDMIDINGDDVTVDFSAELKSTAVDYEELNEYKGNVTYPWTGVAGKDNALTIIVDGLSLKKGAMLDIDVQVTHENSSGSASLVTFVQPTTLSFNYFLTKDYASIGDLVADTDFLKRVGVYGDTAKDMDQSCSGDTWTDTFNCAMPATLESNVGTLYKLESGINSADTPVKVQATTIPIIGDVMVITLPAVRYVDNLVAPTQDAYEYLKYISATALFREIGDVSSLHSNRGYEAFLIYMDEYGRTSNAFDSDNNTVHIPASASTTANSIEISIPKNKRAPYWASRFKFALKADKDQYDTIFCRTFYTDKTNNDVWFLLEGEQARKVEEGDVLIVKSDTVNPTSSVVETTVLSKGVKEYNFITAFESTYVPAGVYMKLNPGNFAVSKSPDSFIKNQRTEVCQTITGLYVQAFHSVSMYDGSAYSDYTIPAGSVIRISINTGRRGTKSDGSGSCKRRDYHLNLTLVSTTDYLNIYDWFIGDNIGALMDTGIKEFGDSGDTMDNIFIPTLGEIGTDPYATPDLKTNYYQFFRDPATNQLRFVVIGTRACGSNGGKKACTDIQFTVERALDTIIFETKPKDAVDNIMYISSESYEINQSGFHVGDVQTQNASLPAIINTKFSNCYTFGNGVESYKIQDSITGKTFALGMQVTANSEREQKETEYLYDLTYSGVFDEESNYDRMNVFNEGALNFKRLEPSLGPIGIIDGRAGDLIVIQRDNISYVMYGKNLLTDAIGGSTLVSVPEVLGNQIPRTEEYGISNDLATYTKWGNTRYWSDSIRGVVLSLTGSSAGGDSLEIISDQGMSSWFRDKFLESENKLKLGGYDAYANEYVLSILNRDLPKETQVLGCGAENEFTLDTGESVTFISQMSTEVGECTIEFDRVEGENNFSVVATYNGTPSGGSFSDSGSFVVDKAYPWVNEIAVTLTATDGPVILRVKAGCPVFKELRVVIFVASPGDVKQFSNDFLMWQSGEYTSPTLKIGSVLDAVTTEDPVVYSPGEFSGPQGTGLLPVDGATVSIINVKGVESGDSVFDINEGSYKYYALKTDAEYEPTIADVSSIILNGETSEIIPEKTEDTQQTFQGQFTMPAGTAGNLYIVLDYR